MLEGIPKISILVITYKQEKIVPRALESLISQRDYIYEICISDDCSPDGTFEVLKDYQQRYPDLIKLHRNEHNLGIFQNVEVTWNLPSGDIIYRLAGDDETPNGYFKSVIEFIEKERIDWKNELFCIYGNYKEIEPNGLSIVYSNSMVTDHDALKLKVRKLLSNRSACYSKKVLDKFEKVCDGRSFNAESVQDGQLQVFAEKNYYLPVVGNIYYADSGVSSRMNSKEHHDNIFKGYQRLIDFADEHGHPFDKNDLAFIEYMKAYRSHDFKQALKYYLKGIDFALGLKGLNLRRILYVVQKRTNKK
ncbi:MAG: glycosyltransferase family 2 protein [Paludibacteraceae bacterium]|nr:glycosyltransferase family 2 protein [Paludibacteraceae bacterium]